MLKKGDLILVAFILAIVAAGFAGFRLYSSTGGANIAVIKQNNEIIRKINLDLVSKPEKLVVPGKYNNVILIEKGRIRFEESDCPDGVCVNTGWLNRKGQTAVCLPNRVIIKIEGSSEEIDGTTY